MACSCVRICEKYNRLFDFCPFFCGIGTCTFLFFDAILIAVLKLRIL